MRYVLASFVIWALATKRFDKYMALALTSSSSTSAPSSGSNGQPPPTGQNFSIGPKGGKPWFSF